MVASRWIACAQRRSPSPQAVIVFSWAWYAVVQWRLVRLSWRMLVGAGLS